MTEGRGMDELGDARTAIGQARREYIQERLAFAYYDDEQEVYDAAMSLPLMRLIEATTLYALANMA